MSSPSAAIYCEVCNLPHTPRATRCEACGHSLGTAPDTEKLRKDLRTQRRTFLLSLFVTMGFIALDITMVDQGAARVLICVPALAGVVWSAYRYRLLAAWLSKKRGHEGMKRTAAPGYVQARGAATPTESGE